MINRFVFWISIALAVNFIAGLLAFAIATNRLSEMFVPEQADGLVVLTGGSGERIKYAGDLLQQNKAKRLLITGANPDVSHNSLRKLSGLPKARFSCCVDVDNKAKNTVGNARQISLWASAQNYDHLLIVTSSYHIPRAWLILRTEMPDTRLALAPVKSIGNARQHVYRRTLLEYGKYLVVLVFPAQQRQGD
ncbi:MAG: YdcF family protein [Robiginitomaculum sp.]|nr:YdcF family protein [Robiginitomaculum sp.]